jgi:uncharacterized protein YndB with AHSA1/START domain
MADNELLIVRTFKAPVALVFRMWELPEHYARWLGPKDFTASGVTIDFRVGGAWRACVSHAGHGDNWMGGVYREIERDRRLVFTFAWEDGRDQPGVETLVTLTFEDRDGDTVMTFHQSPFVHVEARDSHIAGWTQVFDKLEPYVETLAKEQAR